MSTTAKYDEQAERWTEQAYSEPSYYLARRARALVETGPALCQGDRVLDLACGDGGFADPLLARGLAYTGVDANEHMVRAARRRLGDRARVEHGDLNDYRPAVPVAVTCVFRAIYYARDRRDFFRSAASYTTEKLVFDLNPRQYALAEVRRDLEAVGFDGLDIRPFFTPQTRAVRQPLRSALAWLEHSGPIAKLLLRRRFTYLCAAYRRA